MFCVCMCVWIGWPDPLSMSILTSIRYERRWGFKESSTRNLFFLKSAGSVTLQVRCYVEILMENLTAKREWKKKKLESKRLKEGLSRVQFQQCLHYQKDSGAQCLLLDTSISTAIPEDLQSLSLQASPALSAKHHLVLSRIAATENDPTRKPTDSSSSAISRLWCRGSEIQLNGGRVLVHWLVMDLKRPRGLQLMCRLDQLISQIFHSELAVHPTMSAKCSLSAIQITAHVQWPLLILVSDWLAVSVKNRPLQI